MDNKSESSCDISLDSLENDYKRKHLNLRPSDENVDTILVPLYEKDVLIKIPKRKKKQNQSDAKFNTRKEKSKQETNEITNYLVNKDLERVKKKSYLEMFRKQFTSSRTETLIERANTDIRSISPEFGDTERSTIGDESTNHVSEFYNTESYNEIYYNKLMKKELDQYLEQSFEDVLHLNEDEKNLRVDLNDNNLKSISEVSQARRRIKSKIFSPIQNVHLGGLGPDMEKIKPRLERARSLQRYSEKVRMENRLKIYKKEVQDEKNAREASVTRQDSIEKQCKKNCKYNSSYLVNKSVQEKSSLIKKICNTKSKSADFQSRRERDKQSKEKNNRRNNIEKNITQNEKVSKLNKGMDQKNTQSAKSQGIRSATESHSSRLKSGSKIRGVNIETIQTKCDSPLQISFMFNVGGVRPSSALKSLEEKHRMYQEKVKQYR
ncbi:uncharacterized protein LOC125069526 [Vanessa atalanta]|uniref:uncharacterized protein LOC125069526 n=1 Tax=Vanessa atalanta TaxID=42275 RepID=UPI001FCD0492|nr:uncharacterized protein LOC125069526 [Vanessa atalanta]